MDLLSSLCIALGEIALHLLIRVTIQRRKFASYRWINESE